MQERHTPFLERRPHFRRWHGIGRTLRRWQSALVAASLLMPGLPCLRSQTPAASSATEKSLFQQSAATAAALARAARNLPDFERLRTTQAALSIILLTGFDRLLPNLPPAALDQVADVFLRENPDPAEQAAVAAKFPPADTLVFDGTRLTGGNFRDIDALIGAGGRPVALDRDLPVQIVPLEASRAQALESTRAAGMPPQKFLELQNLFDRIHAASVSNHLVADGLFLRPYAGRLDDLYHHLVQQGGRNGQLDYFALMDNLPPRQYSPLSGTAARKFVPPPRVHLSNVLSGGSLQAIQNFKTSNPRSNVQNPFKGFAVRTLPYLGDELRKTAPGSTLTLSGELMRRAISDPRRFTPGKVPPLFLDPSRFLGRWEDPRFLFVAKKKKSSNAELFAEIQKVDFDTPLPEISFEPAGNELLAQSPPESAPDATNDLMQDLGLPQQDGSPTGYEPADTPEPVLPPTPIRETEIPASPPPISKPAPPLLDVEPLETPPVFDLAQATPLPTPIPEATATPTPATTPTPALAEQPAPAPSPSATPAPSFLKPSAIAVIPPAESPTPTQTSPAPKEKAAKQEPQIARALPVSPSQERSGPIQDSSATAFQVAVLTPTALESIDYLKKIAASDIALSDNLAISKRADCVIRWLGEAVKPFEPLLTKTPESTEAQAVEPLIVQARDEILALLAKREALQATRMQELKTRQDTRQALEKEIQTTRRDELARRTGTGA